MSKSIYTNEYKNILKKKIQRSTKNDARLTQVEVTQKLKKPQSYISKIERD